MTQAYDRPDFPYAADDLPAREPFRQEPDPRPERPADLVVNPPRMRSESCIHADVSDVPAHWHWLRGRPRAGQQLCG